MYLAALPTSVSVGPTARMPAVGHDESISYVDLASPALVTNLSVTGVDISDVVLAGNGYIYAFTDALSRISCVNIDNGVWSPPAPA